MLKYFIMLVSCLFIFTCGVARFESRGIKPNEPVTSKKTTINNPETTDIKSKPTTEKDYSYCAVCSSNTCECLGDFDFDVPAEPPVEVVNEEIVIGCDEPVSVCSDKECFQGDNPSQNEVIIEISPSVLPINRVDLFGICTDKGKKQNIIFITDDKSLTKEKICSNVDIKGKGCAFLRSDNSILKNSISCRSEK